MIPESFEGLLASGCTGIRCNFIQRVTIAETRMKFNACAGPCKTMKCIQEPADIVSPISTEGNRPKR